MKRRLILVATIAAMVGLYAGWELQTFFSIDGCLDAGGRWDYQRGLCEGIIPDE